MSFEDISHWLQIPEIMIVGCSSRSRWVDIRCTHWGPIHSPRGEAYLFRVCMPDAEKKEYSVEIQWDNGEMQKLGASTMDVSSAQMLVYAFMYAPEQTARLEKHMKETQRLAVRHPELVNAVDLVVALIEEEITKMLEDKAVSNATDSGNVADSRADTAQTLTEIRKHLDIVFLAIAGGATCETVPISKESYIMDIATSLNDIATESRQTYLRYENWIYAELRYQLRWSMQLIYRNHTGQAR